uniref:Uncharacterized protein n=1 Tax=Anguilla anguilla TaxID=7936 RepID=A0A0E9XG61_ANGAN
MGAAEQISNTVKLPTRTGPLLHKMRASGPNWRPGPLREGAYKPTFNTICHKVTI